MSPIAYVVSVISHRLGGDSPMSKGPERNPGMHRLASPAGESRTWMALRLYGRPQCRRDESAARVGVGVPVPAPQAFLRCPCRPRRPRRDWRTSPDTIRSAIMSIFMTIPARRGKAAHVKQGEIIK